MAHEHLFDDGDDDRAAPNPPAPPQSIVSGKGLAPKNEQELQAVADALAAQKNRAAINPSARPQSMPDAPQSTGIDWPLKWSFLRTWGVFAGASFAVSRIIETSSALDGISPQTIAEGIVGLFIVLLVLFLVYWPQIHIGSENRVIPVGFRLMILLVCLSHLIMSGWKRYTENEIIQNLSDSHWQDCYIGTKYAAKGHKKKLPDPATVELDSSDRSIAEYGLEDLKYLVSVDASNFEGHTASDGKGTTDFLRLHAQKRLPIWRKAAELGIPDGEFLYGCCLNNGFGVATNVTEGTMWLCMAAEQGSALGQECTAIITPVATGAAATGSITTRSIPMGGAIPIMQQRLTASCPSP